MRYEPLYKDFELSEARALWVVGLKQYRTMTALAKELGVCPTYLSNYTLKRGLNTKQAGFIGRKFKIDPAVFCYEEFLRLSPLRKGDIPAAYKHLLVCDFFDEEDVQYILRGQHVKNASQWLLEQDAAVVKLAKRKR